MANLPELCGKCRSIFRLTFAVDHSAVFKIDAHDAELRQTLDIFNDVGCRFAVPGFQIDAERQRGDRQNARHHKQQFIKRDSLAVVVTQHGGNRRAGCAEGTISGLVCSQCAAGIPDVGDNKRCGLVMKRGKVHGCLRL
ncbi:hypothetical protein D3C80_1497850 [compost metagenome]